MMTIDQPPCQTLGVGTEAALPWLVGLDPPHSMKTMVENVGGGYGCFNQAGEKADVLRS